MKLFNLMVEVMLPLALLVGAGALWPFVFPRPEIIIAAAVNLLFAPLIVACAARLLNSPLGEPQHAAPIEAATPAMMTALLLADRFRLDAAAAALLIGWSTILIWISLPLMLALGLIR